MAITTQDGLIAALATATPQSYYKASIANMVAGQLCSLFRATGIPLQGSTPGAWATCDLTTVGGFSYTNPTNPTLTYLGGLSFSPANAGTAVLFDRLAAMGGLSGTSTSAQTVNGSIPANRGAASNGSNVEWYLEWYTDTGSTAVTATITYTNQSDVSGRTTTVSVAATTRAGRMMLIVPAAGDYIKSIQSVTLSASTLTAGSFGVTVVRRLAEIPCSNVSVFPVLDAINLGLPMVYDSSCLFLAVLCSTTSTGVAQGKVVLPQG